MGSYIIYATGLLQVAIARYYDWLCILFPTLQKLKYEFHTNSV